jgi:hypothetical protein
MRANFLSDRLLRQNPFSMNSVFSQFRLLAALSFVALCCSANAAPTDCIPGATDLPGWSQEEKPRTFTQDTLWDLMDGGAEVYVEYGVEGAASVRYKHPGKGSVQVEIYAMKDEGSAFGIYSFNSRTKGKPVKIGDDALLTDYYLLVHKGGYFLSFTAVSDPATTMPSCLELAQAFAARIPASGGRPALLSHLPALSGTSVHQVYFRGGLGLLNLYAFDASDPFKVVEGVAAEADGTQFFVLRQADDKAAAASYDSAWGILSANAKYKVGEGRPGERCLVDENGKFLLLVRNGACNLIAIGADQAALRGLLKQVLDAKQP